MIIALAWTISWIGITAAALATLPEAAGTRTIHDATGLAQAWSRCLDHAMHGAKSALHAVVIDDEGRGDTRELALHIAAMVRRTDIVARLDAKRIVILQPLLSEPADATALRTRIGRALGGPGKFGTSAAKPTRCYIGSALLGWDGNDLADCLARAELRALALTPQRPAVGPKPAEPRTG